MTTIPLTSAQSASYNAAIAKLNASKTPTPTKTTTTSTTPTKTTTPIKTTTTSTTPTPTKTTTPIKTTTTSSPMGVTTSVPTSTNKTTTPITSTTSGSSYIGKNITTTPTATIQKQLGVTADGIYGSKTTAAVKAFQTANGLTPDGIVGPLTLAALNKTGTSTKTSTVTPAYTTPATTTVGGTSGAAFNPLTGKPLYQGETVTKDGITYTGTTPKATPTVPIPTPETPTTNIGNEDVTYKGLLQQLATMGKEPSKAYTDAYNQAQAYNKALQESQITEAKTMADTAAQPIPLPFTQGKQQILQNQYGAIQQALGAGYTGATNLISGANTQQGLMQGALTSALGSAAPTGTFPFVFDPVTGTFKTGVTGTTGGITFTGNPTIDANNAAEAVITGRMTYAQAQQSMSYVGSTADAYLNTAIINKGGDPLKLQASGAASQSNIQSMGTAYTSGQAGSLTDITQRINTLDSTAPTLLADATSLKSILSKFDPSTPIQSGLAQLEAGTISDKQAAATFKSKIQAVRSAYSKIFPDADATQAIPDNTTVGQLSSIIDALGSSIQNQKTGYLQKQTQLLQGGGSTGFTGNTSSDWDSFLSN